MDRPCWSSIAILNEVKKLSPGRVFYPSDKKRLQKFHWEQKLTATIQYDGYEAIVEKILDKSNRLKVFQTCGEELSRLDMKPISSLRKRGERRRAIYERKISEGEAPASLKDEMYRSRDTHLSLLQASNVHQIVKIGAQKTF